MKSKKNSLIHCFNKEWDYGNISTKKIHFGFLKLNKLYNRQKKSTRLFTALIMGIVAGVFSFFLLQGTGIYSLGVAGFFQGISRLIFSVTHLHDISEKISKTVYFINFWILNLIFNLLFGFFGYLKIGKQFTIVSLISITTSAVTGLALSFIPQLQNFYIFSNPLTYDSKLTQFNLQILQWSQTRPNIANDSSRLIIMFMYGVMAGVFTTIPSTLIYIIGGGNGGTDWYLFYYSKKSVKSFALYSMFANLILTFLSFVIGTYIPYLLINSHQQLNISTPNLIANFFSPVLIVSLMYAFVRKGVTKYFYPQFEVVLVKIYTDKIYEMRSKIVNSQFPHSFTINFSTGGFSLTKHPNIEIVCFYKEIPEIIQWINEIDERALITAINVKAMQGKFKVRSDFD